MHYTKGKDSEERVGVVERLMPLPWHTNGFGCEETGGVAIDPEKTGRQQERTEAGERIMAAAVCASALTML